MVYEVFLEKVIGRVTTYMLYKQKRQEKMFEKFMIETKKDIDFRGTLKEYDSIREKLNRALL